MPLPELEIYKDSNEKHPLLFPPTIELPTGDSKGGRRIFKTVVTSKRLRSGDYSIAGAEHLVLIERKGSVGELRGNLFSRDRRRAMAAFTRLSNSCRFPYVLLDCSLAEFNSESGHYAQTAAEIQDRFFREMSRLGIRILWLPTGHTISARQQQGALLLRLMWAHKLQADLETRLQTSEQLCQNLSTRNTGSVPIPTFDSPPEAIS